MLAVPGAPSIRLGAGVLDGATRVEAIQSTGVVTAAGDAGNRISIAFAGTTDGAVDNKKVFFKEVTGKGFAVPVPVTLTSADVARLGDGLVYVNGVQVNRAGQASAVTAVFFVIDTTRPAAPTVTLGARVSDGATRAEATQSSGAVTVAGDSGNRISVSFVGTTNGAVDSSKILLKEVIGRGAGVPVPLTLRGPDVSRLGDGLVYVNCVQVDRAGNPSAVGSAFFTIDTAPPAAPSVQLGVGVQDGATRREAKQASGVVTVSGDVGNRISVSFNGTTNGVVDTTKILFKEVTGKGAGVRLPVTLTGVDVTRLGDGPVYVNCVQVDPAGNAGGLASTSYTVDKTPPAAPAIRLGIGVLDGANRIEATQASGVVAVSGEADSRVGVSFVGTTNGVADGRKVVSKDVLVASTGAWVPVQLTPEDVKTLGDGMVYVNAVQVDPAGRMSSLRTTSFLVSAPAGEAPDLTVRLVDGILRIEGTDGDDAVIVREAGAGVTVDHASGNNIIGHLTFPQGVSRIEVLAGGGQDMIVLRAPSFASRTVVDTGAGTDLVVSPVPVDARAESGVDLPVPTTDRSLAAGSGVTTRRTETPRFARETSYVGQSLMAARTWMADGRLVAVSLDAQGNTVRDTYLDGRVALAETWDTNGGYQRTVTAADGTRLRETFEKGKPLMEERERDGESSATAWGADGSVVRHAVGGSGVTLEEVWDGAGGYRRTRVDGSGTVTKEVFDHGVLDVKTIVNGRRVERIGRDPQGNGVYEELVDDVLVRRDQWDTTGGCLITRFVAGRLYSRETLRSGRRVQLEMWPDGQLVRTAWNESDDRIVQSFVGDRKIREEEIRTSGERRLTEWVGAETIRTTTDTAGNVCVERSTGAGLISRELRGAAGVRLLTTFDSSTGQAVAEDRTAADGRVVTRTTWSSQEVLRLTSRDGVTLLRESWRDGGLQRTSDDGAGTIRVERFTGSDRATLAEGTKVADTVTVPGGERMETVWDPDGTRRLKGRKDGVLVLEEIEQGGTLTKVVHGIDGSRQEEILGNGVRTLRQSGGGAFREQQFSSSGRMTYELIRDAGGAFQETTWSRAGAYSADEAVTTLVAEGPGTIGTSDTRVRTYVEPGLEVRQIWKGIDKVPDSRTTYYEQSDYTLNGFGGPLSPSDYRQEIRFYDTGRLVYHQVMRGNGSTQVLTNQPSAAWDRARQGSYFGLSGGNVFSLVPGGGTFNLVAVGGYLGDRLAAARATRDKVVGGVEEVFKPLEQATIGVRAIVGGLQSVSQGIDVNFRTLQADLGKVLGKIDFGKITLPKLEVVRFDGAAFSGFAAMKWQSPNIKLANPFASIDFSAVQEPAMWSYLAKEVFTVVGQNALDGMAWLGGRIKSTSDWLADRDPFVWIGKQLGVKWGPQGERKVLLIMPGERYLEAGYTRDQAALLYDLMDRTPRGLRGRFLDEFNTLLAEEGQRIYQAHLGADGGELDAAAHDRLRQAASQTAQSRLLARYGLNPDGTMIPGNAAGLGLGLRPGGVTGPDETDATYSTGANGPRVDFEPGAIQAETPKQKKDDERRKPKEDPPTDDDEQAREDEMERRRREEQERKARIEQTKRDVREKFPAAIKDAASEKLDLYAKGKGKQVADFHDSVEQTLRIGGAFAAGLGEGSVAAVESLAKSIVAACDADTWSGVAEAVRRQGRDFMKAEDKAKFIADHGEQTYQSFRDSVVKSIDEWERASPEARARKLGRFAGEAATEAVLFGALTKIGGKALDSTKLGRKTRETVERVTKSKEFPAYEKRVKDAAGKDKTDLNSLLEGHKKSTGESLAKQLRSQAGMDPEHARKISQFAKERKQVIVVRSSNPASLQHHGKPGHAAKPGDLSLKTNPQTGLVTATRRADGALIDARGQMVDGYKVDAQNRIVNTNKLTGGKPTPTNYRLERGHVVDSKGTRFFSDYDINSIDAEPLAGSGWEMVATGDKTTGPGPIIGDLNKTIVGRDRSRDMFKHGANRENYRKSATGIYQIDTPDIGDTFIVFDSDGTIFVSDKLYVRRLFEGRNIPTADVVPPLPGDDWLD